MKWWKQSSQGTRNLTSSFFVARKKTVQRYNGTRTHDLYDIGASLYWLSLTLWNWQTLFARSVKYEYYSCVVLISERELNWLKIFLNNIRLNWSIPSQCFLFFQVECKAILDCSEQWTLEQVDIEASYSDKYTIVKGVSLRFVLSFNIDSFLPKVIKIYCLLSTPIHCQVSYKEKSLIMKYCLDVSATKFWDQYVKLPNIVVYKYPSKIRVLFI